MGIAKKIALTGGLSIGALLLVGFLASKTNILQRVQTGLSNLGSSLGMGIGGAVGGGLAGIPVGIGEGFTGLVGAEWEKKGAKEIQGFMDWIQGKESVQSSVAGAAGQVSTEKTVTPTSREYSDSYFQSLQGKTVHLGYPNAPTAKITGARPITIQYAGKAPIKTVDIRTTSGFFNQPLANRLQAGQQAVKNYVAPKLTASKAVTGGSRPSASHSGSKTLTKKRHRR